MKKILCFTMLCITCTMVFAKSYAPEIYAKGNTYSEKAKEIARDVVDTADDLAEDFYDKYISTEADEAFMNWVEYKKFCKKHGIPAYYNHFQELAQVQRKQGLNEKQAEQLILKVWNKE